MSESKKTMIDFIEAPDENATEGHKRIWKIFCDSQDRHAKELKHLFDKTDKQQAIIADLLAALEKVGCYCGYHNVKICSRCEVIAKAKRDLEN